MRIINRTLDFYLILLFSKAESEFQHPGDNIYVPKPSGYYYSYESRSNLSFSHNGVINRTEGNGLGTPDILNTSFNFEPSAASPAHRPQPAPPQKFPHPNVMANPLRKESSAAPGPVEQTILNTSPKPGGDIADHRARHGKGTRFPSFVLKRASGYGISADGMLDLSNTNLSEDELRERMSLKQCKTILENITQVNISHNHLEMDLTALLTLLLKIKKVHSIDASYNRISIRSAPANRTCNLEQGHLLFLNLSHNPLNTLQNLCLPPGLRHIDLSFTGISQIPDGFGQQLLDIEELSVQGNRFIYFARSSSSGYIHTDSHPSLSYINIPNQTPIENLPGKVKHLTMSNCSIVGLPKWFAAKLTELRFLDLSNNPLHIFPKLPSSLHQLDLSNGNLQKIAAQNCSSLKQLKMANNKIQSLSCSRLPGSLREFDISNNKLHMFPFLGTLRKLESLNVSRNLIMELNLNRSLPLSNLDASHNILTELPTHMAEFLPQLKCLNLSGNKISYLQPGSLPGSLLELDISHNAIAILMKETFGHLANLNVLTIHGKHFFCNCDLYWFARTYLSRPDLHINGREGLFCSFPPQKRGLLFENSHLTILHCSPSLQMAVIACTAILVMSVLMGLCWRFDGPWYMKMGWYWCMAKRKQYEKRPEPKLYDAFISYSEADGPWTKGTLLEKLEANGFKVCYHERDFRPGHPVLGNIFYCIENSHKVLFILSPSFVNSCWCQYELYFAEHRVLSENQDSLIMVVLEDLPLHSIPQKFSKLRKLMKRKTYLKWSPEEPKQKLFWLQLMAVLRTTNEPVVFPEENGTYQRKQEDTYEVAAT